MHPESVVADGNAACHRDGGKRADELQKGLRGIGSASKKASSEAAERLRVEAETADRKHRSALLNKRTAKMVIQGGVTTALRFGNCQRERVEMFKPELL